MKQIPLSKGKFAMVDDDDFERLSEFKWHCTRQGRAGRIKRFPGSREPHTVLMHREVIYAPDGIQVDHVNLDPLDNRKENLRLATRSENQWNRHNYKTNRTGFKGVGLIGSRGKFRARIMVHGKQVVLGYFESAELASAAYCHAAKEYHGEFARTTNGSA